LERNKSFFNRVINLGKIHILTKVHDKKGGKIMSRRRGVMSDQFKIELAKELGFYDTVTSEGWGGITTRDAGNMVKKAIEIAERGLAEQGRS